MESPPKQPPGWYADPWAPGAMRWWDGAQWSSHATPVATYGARPVDGFAIAALILGVVGVSILAIVFGFVARGRIKRSGGLKGGSGLATAGIALGFTWFAVIGVVVALAVTGVFDSQNSDDYSGAKRPVAQQVDEFEAAMDDNDGERICRDLLTERYAQSFETEAGGCAGYWSSVVGPDEIQAEIDVHAIDINGRVATADVDEGGLTETFTFVHDGAKWRLDWIVVDEG